MLVGHAADERGTSIKGITITCSTDDANFATCVKLGKVSKEPGWLREPMNAPTNTREGDFKRIHRMGRSVWSGVCADCWYVFKQHWGGRAQPSRKAGEELLRGWRELSAERWWFEIANEWMGRLETFETPGPVAASSMSYAKGWWWAPVSSMTRLLERRKNNHVMLWRTFCVELPVPVQILGDPPIPMTFICASWMRVPFSILL